MSYRNIVVDGKQYQYSAKEFIVIKDGKKRFNLRPWIEFTDLNPEIIERAKRKESWYGYHPHHIEKLIRKHFLEQDVDMTYNDFFQASNRLQEELTKMRSEDLTLSNT